MLGVGEAMDINMCLHRAEEWNIGHSPKEGEVRIFISPNAVHTFLNAGTKIPDKNTARNMYCGPQFEGL